MGVTGLVLVCALVLFLVGRGMGGVALRVVRVVWLMRFVVRGHLGGMIGRAHETQKAGREMDNMMKDAEVLVSVGIDLFGWRSGRWIVEK